MINDTQLSKLHNELVRMKKETGHLLEQEKHFGMDEEFIQESLGELSNYDNHPADHGTELFERQKDLALNDHIEKQLKDIDYALQKIEEGTYGKCETCGIDIPYGRLEALPTAVHCIKHTPDTGVAMRRPIEESILGTPFIRYTNDDGHDATFYDAEDAWQDVARYGTSETPSDFYDRDNFSYETMFMDNEDLVSVTEQIENFVATDIHGRNIKVFPNLAHEQYENVLDEEYQEMINQVDPDVRDLLD